MPLLTIVVLACWPAYLALFVGRPSKPQKATGHDSLSLIGVLLQFGAVVLIWVWRRPLFSAFVPNSGVNTALFLVATIGAIGAVVISRRALFSLGENWSFVAAVGEGHQLVQKGPYAVVRHPLYAGFYLLTGTTAIVWSTPGALAVGTVVFGLGVWIRIKVEEALLSRAFGARFDAYRGSVPAVLPFGKRKKV